MIRQGLRQEVEALFRQGYTPENPGMRAIGYREFFVEENGKWSISGDTEGVKELIARNSRRYAKRQETFFASIPDVTWISAKDALTDTLTALDLLSSLLHTECNPNA
jgi:tRNA dimethylallyltransferase